MQADQSAAAARIALRPIASPLPLGMLALSVGTFILAGLQLGWIPLSQSRAVGLVILGFVVPLQTVSFIYGFLARDPAASTGMALTAGAWSAIGLVALTGQPGRTSPALGLLLLGAATAMLVPAVTASLTKLLASLVMLLTAARFYLTGAYEMSSAAGWKTAAAVTGLVLAVVALYAGLAFELEDNHRGTVLPTLRRRSGRTAVAGSLADEVTGVQHEAGVRRAL